MTRKDTILIAVLINAGLLAVLFVTAVIYDTEKILDQADDHSIALAPVPLTSHSQTAAAISHPSEDEVDNVLHYYAHSSSPLLNETHTEVFPLEPASDVQARTAPAPSGDFVEVTVKRGDMLEKIARANGTSVHSIKKINQLQSERLSVGQVLKVPVKKDEDTLVVASQAAPAAQPAPVKVPAPAPQRVVVENRVNSESTQDVQYYTIKSGDNPWKLAKQFNVKFDDILRLNNLDEEKARNLKVGDRVRVK